MTRAICSIPLSTETVPDDPILALKAAIKEPPWLYIEPILAAGNPRYNADTHAIEFEADVTITAPQVTIRSIAPALHDQTGYKPPPIPYRNYPETPPPGPPPKRPPQPAAPRPQPLT